MQNIRIRSAAVVAAALLLVASPLSASAAYNDFDAITSHVGIAVPQSLDVTRPSKEKSSTSAQYYYLTGSSDPAKALTMNGEEVAGRGEQGSFGVYVTLAQGENTFTFKNGGQSKTVTLVRGGSAAVGTTEVLTKPTPLFDVAALAGSEITFTCVAPAGAKVTATFNGKTVQMKQNAAAAVDGVPAGFTGTAAAPDVSGTKNLGAVTYTMTFGGKTSTYTSAGALFAVGKGETLLVRVKEASATVFETESTGSSFIATAKEGAVDYVTDIGSSLYKLGMGGWIQQDAVQPLTENAAWENTVSDVTFSSDAGGESFVFHGTGTPVFASYQNAEKLYIRFAHTSGIRSVPTGDSALFSQASVTREGDATVLELKLSGKKALWGYAVEYGENGTTTVYCTYKPRLSSGAQPLSGVTVALDAGHGGTDSGALGIQSTKGPVEKEITYDTTRAVQKRLESLGATVTLVRPEDVYVDLSGRMRAAQAERADFFLSLHCNSIGVNQNGLKPSGVEVFYYEDISAAFARTIESQIVAKTGRTSRGAKYSNYKVTLNTYAPSVLVEMGFLTNPAEYDSLCSKQGIFKMANAIGDGIVSYLS